MRYSVMIGLEIHMQLKTNRKMFAEEGYIYGEPPNTQTSPTSLAHPGTMPVPNKKVIEYAIRMGLACNAKITERNFFDRKNYRYADLPKSFQITQNKTPICTDGILEIDLVRGQTKKIRITCIQLEEDTGKSIHSPQSNLTSVNFDRAGVPLIEIVTEPDFSTAEEAGAFLTEIRRLGLYLDICNGNMEEGALRCDANVSIMPEGSDIRGQKVELKNMNSTRNVRLAIKSEIQRQQAMKKAGKKIASQTRRYNPETGKTYYQRSKESLTDYRFFTEPDLSPFYVRSEWIDEIRQSMPVLPRILVKKFIETYQLSHQDAITLTNNKEGSLFFEALCKYTPHYKIAANWVLGPIKSYLNDQKLDWLAFLLPPISIAKLTDMVAKGEISFSIASQTLFSTLLKNPKKDPDELLFQEGAQINDASDLMGWIDQALKKYPEKIEAYRKGQKGLIGLFMGEIMQLSRRKANPKKTIELLRKKLDAAL